jgi:hypothetical protein
VVSTQSTTRYHLTVFFFFFFFKKIKEHNAIANGGGSGVGIDVDNIREDKRVFSHVFMHSGSLRGSKIRIFQEMGRVPFRLI